ncbi:MAG: DUF1289 domain-containing protein [Pseudomonadota bacterium]
MVNTGSPQSPCISICTLDENDRCVGCLRTLDEIMDWTVMDDAAKQQVLDNVAARVSERQKAG